ncbi:sensor histidine kinase [Streptacidiphilus jiangxiensis]|uniref:histidine kinase n=1 Tax=Streptacidiphilus jiangxiensis TaxID=235985 RepID=A0A1H7V8A2_STRJI|nr:sensor histidine kinase [Streptacidiphilus jiangxiensis]SEM05502.1 Signal transduction histidine kinase [Streptacidiphilus jiangxiensis]
MNEDGGLKVKRFRALLRELREDLVVPALTAAPPRKRVSRWILVPVSLVAAIFFGINTNQYAFAYSLGVPLGLALAAIQSGALVASLWQPLRAWWVATLVMVVGAWTSTALAPGRGVSFPLADADRNIQAGWTPATITVQAVLLFLLSLQVRGRVAIEAFGVTVFAGFLAQLYKPPGQATAIGFAVILFAVVVLLGVSIRAGREARSKLVEQEELTAEERARRTLLEERNRIARELHDVVAHHMSVISIQAQVAPHLVENPPAELVENLAGIRANAVEALAELRRVLGVLRSEEPAADGTQDAPQPTLERLGELLENVRAAGMTVKSETAGEPRTLPPGVELSAYRIVQEALSNAMRHAPGAAVRVELDYRAAGLGVRVTNTAPTRRPAPSPGAGHGLLGMRERTAMLGGELATGATPDGGFEVFALLPAGRIDINSVPAGEDRA